MTEEESTAALRSQGLSPAAENQPVHGSQTRTEQELRTEGPNHPEGLSRLSWQNFFKSTERPRLGYNFIKKWRKKAA